jgi:hypothetical protein
MATGSAKQRAVRQRGWLKMRGWKRVGELVSTAGITDAGGRGVPGCAAEVMAVPLAVKDLRPLRGAFGVLDREPLARHRQTEGQAGACLS